MHDKHRGTLSHSGDAEKEVVPASGPDFRDQNLTVASGGVASSALKRQRSAVLKLPPDRRALHSYTVFVAISILLLICSGGLVTSNDAGLAVPDWPTSFGYNMFAFPLSRWLAPGGVRLEHAHRLIATSEGMLTIVLALWMGRVEPRRWVRNLGYATLGAVVFQGMLGGLRVVLRADWIGIVHGCFAQAFFALTAVIALVTSRWWLTLGAADRRRPGPAVLTGLSKGLLTAAVLIYLQLALGASMRHAHAGLSIHDFPTAYGHWWPQIHKADIPALNRRRTEILHEPPTSLAQIHLQMTHRMNAGLILIAILGVAWAARECRHSLPGSLRWLATAGVGLVAVQITLGMYTIWSNKAADVATAHVAVGATLFVWSVVSYVSLRRWMNVPRTPPSRENSVAAALNLEAMA